MTATAAESMVSRRIRRWVAMAIFVFGEAGRLTAAGVGRSRDGTGRGFSIGTQTARAADQPAYLPPSVAHLWGRSTLRRLPVTLNAQGSLATGRAGFEGWGATTRVGQNAPPSTHATALLRQQTGQ